jgi:hypothetical protein
MTAGIAAIVMTDGVPYYYLLTFATTYTYLLTLMQISVYIHSGMKRMAVKHVLAAGVTLVNKVKHLENQKCGKKKSELMIQNLNLVLLLMQKATRRAGSSSYIQTAYIQCCVLSAVIVVLTASDATSTLQCCGSATTSLVSNEYDSSTQQ